MDDQDRDTMRTRLERLGGAARRAETAAKDARETRNAAVWEADAAGWTVRAIAQATGYESSTIHGIVSQPH